MFSINLPREFLFLVLVDIRKTCTVKNFCVCF